MSEFEQMKVILQTWYNHNYINLKFQNNTKFNSLSYQRAIEQLNAGHNNYYDAENEEDTTNFPFFIATNKGNEYYHNLFLWNENNKTYENITPKDNLYHILFYSKLHNTTQEYFELSVNHSLISNPYNFSWEYIPQWKLFIGYNNKGNHNVKFFNVTSDNYFVFCPSEDGICFTPNKIIPFKKDNIKFLVQTI